MTSLKLPNNQTYTFGYESQWGLINSITYPTGATVSYTWGINPLSEPFMVIEPSYDEVVTPSYSQLTCYYEQDLPTVQTRTVSYDGVHPALKQVFAYSTTWGSNGSWTAKQTKVTTTDLIRAGTPSTVTIYNYKPYPTSQLPWIAGQGYIPQESSIVYQDGQGNTLKTVVKVWLTTDLLGAECDIIDAGHISGRFYTYQSVPGYGQVNTPTDVAEFDYGQGVSTACGRPQGTPARETVIQYASLPSNTTLWPSNSLVTLGVTASSIPQISDRPSNIQVFDHGTLLQETDISYDETAVSPVSPSAYGHDETNYGPNQTTTRGNPTTITRKCIQNCQDVITKISYDETGQIVSVTDPNGNTRQMSYADAFSQGGSPASGVSTNTYVTAITRPTTNGVAHTSSFSYNYMLGELASVTDENKQVFGYQYNDVWGRPTLSTQPDGGQRSSSYNDAGPEPTISSGVLQNTSGGTIEGKTVFDGMSHPIESLLTSDPDGQIESDTQFDGMGLVYTASNPYRSTSDPTYGITTSTYDALGRLVQLQRQDGKTASYEYSGNCVTETDENANQWDRCYDAFGRLVNVIEPNGTNHAPSLETDYVYDAANNLTSVQQWGGTPGSSTPITRSFSYDSLSRLISADNPEAGISIYSYDPNGNVLSKTDARSITTSYRYDSLNRVLSKTYSTSDPAGTPYSCFQYDSSSVPFGIGRLSAEWTQSPTVSGGQCSSIAPGSGFVTEKLVSAYNPEGRLKSEEQCTPSTCKSTPGYQVNYGYDLAGELTSYTNGLSNLNAQITLTQAFSTAGRLKTIGSSNSSFPSCLFAAQTAADTGSPCTQISSGPAYSASGALQSAFLGTGLTLTQSFDNRLRITGGSYQGAVAAGATSGTATITITGQEQTQ